MPCHTQGSPAKNPGELYIHKCVSCANGADKQLSLSNGGVHKYESALLIFDGGIISFHCNKPLFEPMIVPVLME